MKAPRNTWKSREITRNVSRGIVPVTVAGRGTGPGGSGGRVRQCRAIGVLRKPWCEVVWVLCGGGGSSSGMVCGVVGFPVLLYSYHDHYIIIYITFFSTTHFNKDSTTTNTSSFTTTHFSNICNTSPKNPWFGWGPWNTSQTVLNKQALPGRPIRAKMSSRAAYIAGLSPPDSTMSLPIFAPAAARLLLLRLRRTRPNIPKRLKSDVTPRVSKLTAL
ncbi:hypothetical protein E2C01_022867 [Portunus trituberculatus]|uniref:Uncharacterized protein n=1 Tax=Portunus trituberculatus TaxID=210409 RepID=A0A5B7E8T7_PORTR|nr:hypothetical protein [Portunus trituberculatus]